MGHYHDHSHHTPHIENINRAFIWGIGLNLAFVIVEAGAGLYLNSLALLSDAGHNLSDVVSLILALFAFRLMKVKASVNYTYGYKKSTILVSLLNAIILLVAVGVIFSESIEKLKNPQPIEGNAIAWVAGIGIFINDFRYNHTIYKLVHDRPYHRIGRCHRHLNIDMESAPRQPTPIFRRSTRRN